MVFLFGLGVRSRESSDSQGRLKRRCRLRKVSSMKPSVRSLFYSSSLCRVTSYATRLGFTGRRLCGESVSSSSFREKPARTIAHLRQHPHHRQLTTATRIFVNVSSHQYQRGCNQLPTLEADRYYGTLRKIPGRTGEDHTKALGQVGGMKECFKRSILLW